MPGARRHPPPRAHATRAEVWRFDPRRRDPYAQSTGPRAADEIAPTSAHHADAPRVTPSAIRTEATVGNQITDRPCARATHAQAGHFEPVRRNPYAQRTHPLAPDDTVSAPARAPRLTPSAIRDEPNVGNPTTDLPRARATRAQAGHFEPARRNPYAQRTRPLAPDNAASAPARPAAGPRVTPSVIRDEPPVANQTTSRPHTPVTYAQAGHFEPARRNPYAQRTRPPAPDDTASAPARHAAVPRVTPSAIHDEPPVANQITDRPRARATRAQPGHSDSARRNQYAQRPGPPAPDDAAPAHRPAGLRLAPAAIGPGPGIEGRAIDFPTNGRPAPRMASTTPPRRGRSSAMASWMYGRSRRR